MKFHYFILIIFALGQLAKNVTLKYILVEIEKDTAANNNEGKIFNNDSKPYLEKIH